MSDTLVVEERSARFSASARRGLLVAAWVIGLGAWGAILVQEVSFSAFAIGNLSFAAVGTILVLRRPGNIIGPLMVTAGVGWMVFVAGDVTAESLAAADHVRAAGWVALVTNMATLPALWGQNVALWILFPDGRPHSRGERRFLVASAVWMVAGTVATAFALPQVLGPDSPAQAHPFLDGVTEESIGSMVAGLFVVPLFLCGIVLSIRLVVRARRSDGVARRQVVVVGVASVVNITLILVNAFGHPFGRPEERAFLVLDAVAFLVIAGAFGVAIMRYRLYEIDAIVSKSVTYLGLAASISALYVGIVVVPILVIGDQSDGGPGLLLPIVATAVVALLFEPLRRRLQRVADRLVYGQRSTPHEVLTDLTARLADSGSGRSLDELARLLAQGTAAEEAVIVSGAGSEDRVEGRWARDGSSAPELDLLSDREDLAASSDDECVAVESVRHGEALLGRVVIRKPASDPVAPPDRELLTDVAAGAGLVLRNLALNRELEERAVEVRESRWRLIAAQDAERHRLERDLHDGAQQQIVALKVKLGLAQTIARREGAEDLAGMVEDLAVTTQDAVDAMRTIAHGIYPPLLDSEGLGAALGSVARTSPMAVEVETVGVARYPRPVEETIYFCVQETLQRARDTGIDDLSVALTDDRTGHLTLTVVHPGPPLDLTVVTDRIDAFGGTVRDPATSEAGSVAWHIPATARDLVTT